MVRVKMFKIQASYFIFILPAISVVVLGDQTTVVTPLNKTYPAPAVGFVIIPGAQIEADRYLPLGKQVQKDSQYSLWVATVGGWTDNLINPLQLPSLVQDAINKMQNVGLPKDAPVFLAAHSLGGVFLDMYIRGNSSSVTGIILYSSYISHSVKLKDYPVPVLTLSGDQDGMCRMTRIIKDFGQLKKFTTTTPVVIVPGVNHSLVASGKMPDLVEKNDLVADCTEEQAHALLSKVTNAFFNLHGPLTGKIAIAEATHTLQKYFNDTKDIASPYLEAIQLDAGGFPSWAQWTALFLSDVTDDNIQLDGVGIPLNDASFMLTNPTIKKLNNTALNMTVPFHNDMPVNPLDISLIQQSPEEVLVKTVSKAMLRQYLPNATFADRPRLCNDSNYATRNMILLSIPYQYWMRYMAKGRQVEIGSDNVLTNEFTWFSTGINWINTDHNTAIVTSPSYSDDNIMMCKVLSLSKFIEWVLIDSFKKS